MSQNEVYETRREGPGWHGNVTCEAAPVQIDGAVDGHPFYFRSRHRRWSFATAAPGRNAVEVQLYGPKVRGDYRVEETWGTTPHGASYMPLDDAWTFIEREITRFRRNLEMAADVS